MRRAAAVLAMLALLAGCNPKPPGISSASPSVSPSATPNLPPLIVTGQGTAAQPIRILQSTKENRVQYELLARSLQSSGSPGTERITFSTVHVTFHGKDGSQLEADAPKALIDQRANTVTLSGGVRARNNAGMTLLCDTLTYNRDTEMIGGTGHVAITNKNGLRADGSRFDSDIALTHTRMQ
jgi:LPS export ABC transporter protein LptC